MPPAQLAEVAIVDLGSYAELIGDLSGRIGAEVGELATAYPRRIHREPVVVVGVDESLRRESMHLYGAVEYLEFLCVEPRAG